jgi:hypothetical protein
MRTDERNSKDMTNPIDHDDSPAIDVALRVDGDSTSGGVLVKLDPADVLNLADETNTLYVLGGAGDSVDAGGGWSAAGQETVDGAVFNVYTQEDAVLKVDCAIDQSLIGLA